MRVGGAGGGCGWFGSRGEGEGEGVGVGGGRVGQTPELGPGTGPGSSVEVGSHLDHAGQQREARGGASPADTKVVHHHHVQRARVHGSKALDALDELGIGVRDQDDVALRVAREPAGRGQARAGGGGGGGGERDVDVWVAEEAREHDLYVGYARLHTRGV